MASRLPLECSGFLEKDLEGASWLFREELRGGEGYWGSSESSVFYSCILP